MPINSEWVNPQKSLIFAKLEGKVSSQEVLAYDEQIRAMLAEVTHPVDLIMDYSRQVYFDAEYAETAQKLKAFERATLRPTPILGERATPAGRRRARSTGRRKRSAASAA